MAPPDERRENGKEKKETREIILARWGTDFWHGSLTLSWSP
jgi:hypothetical protein